MLVVATNELGSKSEPVVSFLEVDSVINEGS